MDEIKILDLARSISGSDAETARLAGLTRQRIDNVRRGHNKMSAVMRARVYQVALKSPRDGLIEGIVESARNARDKQDIKNWLGVACVILSLCLFCANPYNSVAYAGTVIDMNIHYAQFVTASLIFSILISKVSSRSFEIK